MTLEKARRVFTAIRVHTPTLDSKNRHCLKGRDGICGKCEFFVGYVPDEDGVFNSYTSLEGFCGTDLEQLAQTHALDEKETP